MSPQVVLEGCVTWLIEQAAWLNPQQWETVLPARPFRAGPLLETLQLAAVLRRDGLDQGLARALAGPTGPILADPAFERGLRSADPLFPYHVWLLGAAAASGLRVPERHEALAGRMLAAGVRPDADGVAALELAYAGELLGIEGGLEVEARFAHWLAGRTLDPFRISDLQAYALTHAVFYVTRFGAQPAPRSPALGDLAALAAILSQVCLIRGDLDLGAELALSVGLLEGTQPDPHVLRAIQQAQRSDGAVPGPLHDPAMLDRLNPRQVEGYLFGTCYHTTVAAALACAAALTTSRPAGAHAWVDPAAQAVLARRVGDTGRAAEHVATAHSRGTATSAVPRLIGCMRSVLEVLTH